MSENSVSEKPSVEQKSFLGDRFEFKYILDVRTAIEIERYLRTVGLVPDGHSHNGAYTVNSFYFDTPTIGDYREKDGSFLIRKKLRARTYADTWSENPEDIWLEIKKKRNMNIKKSRMKINRTVWESLLGKMPLNTFDGIDANIYASPVFREFLYFYKRQLYRPSVIVKYKRMAYMADFLSPIRITFDKDVVACLASDPAYERHMTSVSRDRVIMEVKFSNQLPWWFTHALSRFDIQRDDFSKYRNSLAMIRGYGRIPVDK